MSTKPSHFKVQIITENKMNDFHTILNVTLNFLPTKGMIIQGYKNDLEVVDVKYNIINNSFKVIVNENRKLD
jgi:hypothetical protein